MSSTTLYPTNSPRSGLALRVQIGCQRTPSGGGRLAEDGDVVLEGFGKGLGVVGADYEEMGPSLQF